jgi:uncharacterized protein with GYD domain
MPKYLFSAKYETEGVRGIVEQGGSARREAIEELFGSNGGRLESLHFAFGDTDVYAIGELPDNETAAALALAINADGRTSVTTTVLLTPEEVDAATKATVTYRAPGVR